MSTEFEQNKDPITLTRVLLRDSKKIGASGDFAILLNSIQLAIKVISSATSKAGIIHLHGIHGSGNNQSAGINQSGDVQKKLDVLANDVFINALSFSDQVRIAASEEDEEAVVFKGSSSKYSVVFDPLDGSSLIDCDGCIGTIFGIYKNDEMNDEEINANPQKLILKKGRSLVAAGYVVYGPATIFVLATETGGINEFTLDSTIGEFVITKSDLRLPTPHTNIYSTNTGNTKLFDAATKEYIDLCNDRVYSARYSGSMVGDIHRTICYGGIFLYPGTTKAPNGKLRLLYEVNPISYIIEKAGGKATTGLQNPLDVQPEHIHQRIPIFVGTKSMVEEVEALYKKHGCGVVYKE